MSDIAIAPVAIVTGAGQGLGREIALRFVREGVRVVACDMNPDTLAQTLALAGGSALMRAITRNVTAESAPRDAPRSGSCPTGAVRAYRRDGARAAVQSR